MKLRGLYAITPDGPDATGKVEQALEGGIALLQYRRKGLAREALLQEAAQMLELAKRHRVPFIVNDDVQLALDLDADGVHLGREDGALAAARKRLFGGWEMNWLAYNMGHDVKLPDSSGPKIPYLMYINAESGGQMRDPLDPDGLKYTITAREV